MDELTEARRIIAGMAERFDSLPKCDQRFVETWKQTLSNAQPDFTIGKARMAVISRAGAAYGLVPADVAAARVEEAQKAIGVGGLMA